MLKKELLYHLKSHGIVHKSVNGEIRAYVYANSPNYDTLTLIDGQLSVNGTITSLREWLGY